MKKQIAKALNINPKLVNFREYPATYKGSMKNSIVVRIKGFNDDIRTTRQTVKNVVGTNKELFIDFV